MGCPGLLDTYQYPDSEKFPPGCFYSLPHSVSQFSIAVGNSRDSQVTYKEKRFILALGVGGLGPCLTGHIAVVRVDGGRSFNSWLCRRERRA